MKPMKIKTKTQTMDMTSGPIMKQLILFSLPLLFGNIFQQFYSTVDSVVVGNYASMDPAVNADALGAVTSVGPAVSTLVGLFVGFSTGASVVVSQYFGARNRRALRASVHTSLVTTFVMGLILMVIGYFASPAFVAFMNTPETIAPLSVTYLRIYFLGIEGLMIYNMASAILRAIGNSRIPLYFLILTSLLNVVLDLIFVINFHMGVAGVAWATNLSQFISAALSLVVLFRSREDYGITLREMKIDPTILHKIFYIGLPAGAQMAIISFSNIFVQGYINRFGNASTSGWGAFGRVDAFVILPLQSLALAMTTFVGQNAGAGNIKRIKKGISSCILLALIVTYAICILEFIAAPQIIYFFNQDPDVIRFGTLFVRLNCLFDGVAALNQIHACALRGVGDAKAPMIIMIFSFVIFRQIYLFICTHLTDSIYPVGIAYPCGWVVCSLIMYLYFRKSGWEERVLNNQLL